MTNNKINCIGILTSGSDAPGTNSAIRSIVNIGIQQKLKVIGIQNGFEGLLTKEFTDLSTDSVANILHRGGSILGTAKCPNLLKEAYQKIAAKNLLETPIDALICIGGAGSIKGAHQIQLITQLPGICIPATVHNDVYGTDKSIGFDTATNVAVQAIDRILDTTDKNCRIFIIEVTGKDSGFVAIDVGLGCGASEILIPDFPTSIDQIVARIEKNIGNPNKINILVAAEGKKPGRAYDLVESLRKRTGHEAKVCILGQLQHCGTPTAADRILGTEFGAKAIEFLFSGKINAITALQGAKFLPVPLDFAQREQKSLPTGLIQLARTLSI